MKLASSADFGQPCHFKSPGMIFAPASMAFDGDHDFGQFHLGRSRRVVLTADQPAHQKRRESRRAKRRSQNEDPRHIHLVNLLTPARFRLLLKF